VLGDLSSLRLDPKSDLGIAAQIRARVTLLVADGALEPGGRLPSVRTLARQLGTNVNTVRAAYARLEADGLVSTRHGVGTLVLPASAGHLVQGSPLLASNTVGVLIGGLDPFYLPLLRGIEDVAEEQGTLVLIADTRNSPILAGMMIRRLIARGVDGIIAVSIGGLDDSGATSDRAGVVPPIVYVDQPDRKGYVIVFDGENASYLATRHLRDHGHERIGLVTAPLAWPNAAELHEGYVRALEESGGRFSQTLVSEVEAFTLEAGRSGAARLLDSSEAPSAVFATGEVLALGVLQEARERGMAVPGDLAIAGYTDSGFAGIADPQLTMVSVPAREAGLHAMRTLHALIAGRQPRRRRIVLDVELVVRASCGSHNERIRTSDLGSAGR
jgi:DNA-binding LacI/PurR family transcriptional regulator